MFQHAKPITPPPRIGGRPLPTVGRARMYVCGITPYDTTHLGHARTFVWTDVVARLLRHANVAVDVCRNVTDVDDVLTDAALRAGSPYDSFAAVQQFYFEQDMAALNVQPVDFEPRAHNYVPQVIALAQALLDLGHAYVRDGAVYFRGERVHERAGLDRDEADRLLAEYGDAPEDPAKDHPGDVAVWRPSEAGQPAWPSPWSSGRPGWHAECAAMALSTFGPALDLHAGGADLSFPHHAYEAAMAEAITGVRPFARTWVHVGVVRVDGVKMAKSTGNLVFTADLLRRYPASAVRLALLDHPWAADWDYSPDALETAAATMERLLAATGRAGSSEAAREEALRALLDDLDTRRALRIAEEEGGHTARTVLGVLALT
ncbi:class I tRNA ligase family protein [Thermostaphylospora chromogena]|uniref:Cysteinyl-tRNA synthetase n=1 Tax=Thermostaphylospora chromogena TaxID=35622 RepID=A0A1H1GTQ8_9ACTN|nr:class I tRNA ligase family protein [Thermostaphylospora chromogena]SDR16531.1 cysteinyl-tRNA synthetase [Thermostaphylospora chromogena]